MLDDQLSVSIGMFPLEMKCHPPHQQQQQLHHHHQQQQQQLPPGSTMLMSGNERMLTSAIIQPTINAEALSEMADGGTNVIGSHSNRNNNANNNNSINDNHKTNSSSSSSSNRQQQQSASGPGPPLTHMSINRTTLSECIGNGNSNSNTNTNTHSSSLCSGNGNNPNCGGLQHSHSLPLLPHHLQHSCGGPIQAIEHSHTHHPSHHPSIILQQQQQTLSAALATASATNSAARMAAASGGTCVGAGMVQCGYCCQPICDRYIMRVVDIFYHEGCLKCTTCSIHLVHSCFAREGKLFCRIDYERLFIRNRCLGCGCKIGSDELVMRTLENVFHLKCFACVVCGVLLKKGEQYVVKQGQLFCRFDYEKEVEMLQGYEDFYGDDLFPPKLDGRRGPKRPRTILNTQQRRAFKASFEVSPKPCRKVRENLAKETGLSLRIVQVWFQNQRAKVKKIQKKAKQEQKCASETDSQESDSSLAKIKDENHSDCESLLESPFACSSGGGVGTGAVGADGKFRLIKDELQNENLPLNCIETNKENCNKTNEPILNTILGLSYATFQQLMGPFSQSPMINPIDRLYSMQNSYFRPDELSFSECGKDQETN